MDWSWVWAIEPLAGLRVLGQALAAGRGASQESAAGSRCHFEEGGTLPVCARAGVTGVELAGVQMAGRVGVVPIHGVLTKRLGWMSWLFGGTSTAAAAQAVRELAADDEVDGIVLEVDSPGGSVDGLAELGDAVFAARQRKRVVAHVDGMGASAAYYVASQADAIYLGRMDMVGSIGVRLLVYDMSKLFEEEGIRPVLVDTGEFKSIGAMGVPITESQEAELRRVVETFFEDFKAAVSRGRGLTEADVKRVADGRMWHAADAIRLGLADQIGDLAAAVADAEGPMRARREGQNRARGAKALVEFGPAGRGVPPAAGGR